MSVRSETEGSVLVSGEVPHVICDPHFSEIVEDDGAELAAEEAVDEGVHRGVAVADPQDNAAERERERGNILHNTGHI